LTAASGKPSWPVLGPDATAAHNPFACTMLLSRRLYPQAPGHKLGTLAAFHALPAAGRAHRALADCRGGRRAAGRIQADLRERYAVPEPTHALLMALQTWPRAAVPKRLGEYLCEV
jgi:DNA polymerase-3 subunit epsilon